MAQRQADFCVVGAGFAGLTAALRLQQAGKSVLVLEARNRVGGRVFTETLPDGTWLDYGGTWLGPGQTRGVQPRQRVRYPHLPDLGQGRNAGRARRAP